MQRRLIAFGPGRSQRGLGLVDLRALQVQLTLGLDFPGAGVVQRSTGLVQIGPGIFIIQLHQQLPLLHRLVVMHQHARHPRGDLGAHRDAVGAHIGVVGLLHEAPDLPPFAPHHSASDHARHHDECHDTLACLVHSATLSCCLSVTGV